MATLLPNNAVPASLLSGYRIFVYSHDHPHPPHVHFRKGTKASAWDLVTAECRDTGGFSASDLRKQRTLLTTYHTEIWSAWNDHWKKQ